MTYIIVLHSNKGAQTMDKLTVEKKEKKKEKKRKKKKKSSGCSRFEQLTF